MVLDWQAIENVLKTRLHAILYGPPGTGKTTIAFEEGAYSVTLTAETPAAELRGHYIPHGAGKFVWHHGPAVRAWLEGKRLILNEINEASGDALTFLYALLDDPAMARMTLPTGETIAPAPGFQAIATTNATVLNQALPPALLDRMAIRIHIDEPHPAALKRVNKKLANVVTSTLTKDDDRKVTMRQALAYEAVRQHVEPLIAAKAIFGERGADVFNSIVLAIAADGKGKGE